MPNNHIVEESRHSFSNCRAAFRLLQGALLAGKSKMHIEDIEKLKNRFLYLEKTFHGNGTQIKIAEIDLNPIVDDFFLDIDNLKVEYKNALENVPILKDSKKKILIVDDLFKKAGWKDVFSLILGEERVLGATTEVEAHRILKTESVNIFTVFVDLNIPPTGKTKNPVTGREGLGIISEISRSLSHMPVIAFTACDSSVIAKIAFEEGAWDYFTKEPVGENAQSHNDSITYYSEMVGILNAHIDFSKKYNPLINSTQETIVALINAGVNADFINLIERNLYAAIRYLTMDKVLRFIPHFLEIDKWEEAIFQSTKALDTFLATVLDYHKIFRKDKNGNYSVPTLGDKIHMLKEQDNVGLNSAWFEEAKRIKDLRNDNTHQDDIIVDLNGAPQFSIKSKKADSTVAKKTVKDVLALIKIAADTTFSLNPAMNKKHNKIRNQ